MDMNEKNRDRIEEIKSFELPIDAEQVWADIQPKRKKRRIIFWIWSGIILLLFGIFAFNALTNHKEEKTTNNAFAQATENQEPTIDKVKNTIYEKNKDIIEKTAESPNSIASYQQNDKGHNDHEPVISTGTNEAKAVISATSSTLNKSPSVITSTGNKPPTLSKAGPNLMTDGVQKISLDVKKYYDEIPRLAIFGSKITWDQVIPRISGTLVMATITKEEVGKKLRIQNMEFYSGYGFVNKSLESKSRYYDHYERLRTSIETPLEDWYTGVGLNIGMSQRWNLHVGVEYGQITERMDYTISTIKSDTTYESVLNRVYISAVGDSTLSTGEWNGKILEVTNYKIYNQYRSIDIPIRLQYVYTKDRWRMGASAGIILNTLMRFDGGLVSIDNIFDDNPDFFRKSSGIHLTGGVNLQYRLTPKMPLKFSPSIKYALRGMDTSTYALQQRFNSYRLGLGVVYEL